HLAVVSRPVDCYSRPFILPHTPPSLPLQLLHASGGRLDHGGCAWFYNSALCVVWVCVRVCGRVCGCGWWCVCVCVWVVWCGVGVCGCVSVWCGVGVCVCVCVCVC